VKRGVLLKRGTLGHWSPRVRAHKNKLTGWGKRGSPLGLGGGGILQKHAGTLKEKKVGTGEIEDAESEMCQRGGGGGKGAYTNGKSYKGNRYGGV